MVVLCVGIGAKAASGEAIASETGSLLSPLLQIDETLHDSPTVEQARHAATRFEAELEHCVLNYAAPHTRAPCFLKTLLGDQGLVAAPVSSSSAENTAAFALSGHPGSCAALVATILALTERYGAPFDAVVLRNHVVLSSTAAPDTYFEVLEKGRQLSRTDLSRYGGLDHAIRVDGEEYLSYYLDNLAARLSESGNTDLADRFFRRALQRSPRAGRIHYNYGTFLLQQGTYEQAAEHLTQAIRFGWEDALAYTNRGSARWKLGRPKAARKDYKRALALDPHNQLAAANLERLEEARE